MIRQIIAARACDVFVLKAADAIKLRLVEPIEKGLKLGLSFPRIADDKGRAQGEIGTDCAPGGDLIQGARDIPGPVR